MPMVVGLGHIDLIPSTHKSPNIIVIILMITMHFPKTNTIQVPCSYGQLEVWNDQQMFAYLVLPFHNTFEGPHMPNK